jgi:hypothetical protein
MNSQIVTITIDQGLPQVHDSLRSVCAQGVYQRGLKSVALSINRDAGNLSRELADNGRHLSVDSLEAYISATGDLSPVFYLVERFLIPSARPAEEARRAQVLQQMQALMASLDR